MATYLVYATADALIGSENVSYATARDGSTLGANNLVLSPSVYYVLDAAKFYLSQAFVLFDTSSVVGGLASATFRVDESSDGTGSGSHSTTVRYAPWTDPLTTSNWLTSAAAGALTEACSFTPTAAVDTQHTLALSSISNINQSGTTGLAIIPSAHISGTAPVDNTNYIVYLSIDAGGSSLDPLLTVVTDPTVALTGTITASTAETDIVTGGKTIILTVTDGIWTLA